MPDGDDAAESAPATRRLAAILHADVVGYSRLMGADEAGTHAKLMGARRVIDDLLASHGGRVANTAGDAVLAVFDSVVGAVEAALAIQKALGAANGALAAEERLAFRIGVNLGDVIVDGGDIFGEGVNVAARIEALADPGGVVVSESVRNEVGRRLPVAFTELGRRSLKNIETPVRVFALAESATSGSPPRRRLGRGARAAAIAGAVAASLAVAAIALAPPAFLDRLIAGATRDSATSDPAGGDPADAQVGAARPVIAVMPFTERGASAENAYFADGVTEDVIAALGRFSGMIVLSWNAVEPFRDAPASPSALDALGAAYLVDGSIQRSGDAIRVNVQLSRAEDGVLIWSERYDKPLADVFEVQDRITREVVSALAVRVTESEAARAFATPTDDLGAYDSVLRGREAFRRIERSANVAARELFEQAIARDPGYADAYVELGFSHLADLKFGWTPFPMRSLQAAIDAADTAIALDPLNASAFALRADAVRFLGDLEGAERAAETAVDLNPNDAQAQGIHASLLMFKGRSEEALVAIETAFQLDPRPQAEWAMTLLTAYYMQGRYADVVAAGTRYAREIGGEPTTTAILAAAHAMLGQQAEAEAAAQRVRRNAPFFRAPGFPDQALTPEQRAEVLEGMRRAGLE